MTLEQLLLELVLLGYEARFKYVQETPDDEKRHFVELYSTIPPFHRVLGPVSGLDLTMAAQRAYMSVTG